MPCCSGVSCRHDLPPALTYCTPRAPALQQYRDRWAAEIAIRDSNAFTGLGQDQCRKVQCMVGVNTFRLVMAAAVSSSVHSPPQRPLILTYRVIIFFPYFTNILSKSRASTMGVMLS